MTFNKVISLNNFDVSYHVLYLIMYHHICILFYFLFNTYIY